MSPRFPLFRKRWRPLAVVSQVLVFSAVFFSPTHVFASSHREAPLIGKAFDSTGSDFGSTLITETGDIFIAQFPFTIYHQIPGFPSPNDILNTGADLDGNIIEQFTFAGGRPLRPIFGSNDRVIVGADDSDGDQNLIIIDKDGNLFNFTDNSAGPLVNSGVADPEFGFWYGSQQPAPNSDIIDLVTIWGSTTNPSAMCQAGGFRLTPVSVNEILNLPSCPGVQEILPDSGRLFNFPGSLSANQIPGNPFDPNHNSSLFNGFFNPPNGTPNGTFPTIIIDFPDSTLGGPNGGCVGPGLGIAPGADVVTIPDGLINPFSIDQIYEFRLLSPSTGLGAGTTDEGSPRQFVFLNPFNEPETHQPLIPTNPCDEADINQDGVVDILDLAEITKCIGVDVFKNLDSPCVLADIDQDGIVSVIDIQRISNCILKRKNKGGGGKDLDPSFPDENIAIPFLIQGNPVPRYPDIEMSYVSGIRSNGRGVAVIGVGGFNSTEGEFQEAVLLLDSNGLQGVLRTNTDLGDGPVAFLNFSFFSNDGGLSNVNAAGQFAVTVNLDNGNTAVYVFDGVNFDENPDDVLVLTEHTDIWGSHNHVSELDTPGQLDFTGFQQDPANGWTTLPGFFDYGPSTDFVTVTPLGQAWMTTTDGAGGLNAPVFCSSGWVVNEGQGFTVLAGDFNGDRLTDLAQIHPTGTVFIGLHNGTTIDPPTTTWQNGTFIDTAGGLIPIAGDFDGDGVDDLGQLNNNTGDFWVSLGDSPFTNGFTDWTPTDGVFRHDPSNAMGVHVGDFNGDGIDDLCQVTNANIMTALSDGSAFGTPTIWAINGFADDPSRGANGWWTFAADMNGDGFDDIVQLNSDGEFFYEASNGTDFFVGPPENIGAIGFRHKPQGPWQTFIGRVD